MAPIVAHEQAVGDIHRNRRSLLLTTHKFYVDELKQFNREELHFLLALTLSEILCQDLG